MLFATCWNAGHDFERSHPGSLREGVNTSSRISATPYESGHPDNCCQTKYSGLGIGRRELAMQQLRYILAPAVSVIALAITGVVAQQPPSAMSGAQKLMVVPASKYAGHVYVLPAALETTQWGWFDNTELPRLVIDSGDTVVVETMSHSHGQLWPGRTIEELKKLRTDWPGRGPMSLTGPIFVNGAEPGDVLQIKINKIVGRPWGANFNIPGLFGQFPKEFPDGQVKYFYLDWERKLAEFAPG